MQEATEDKGMEIFAQQRFYVEELDRSQTDRREQPEYGFCVENWGKIFQAYF